jgi:hypothetical protein
MCSGSATSRCIRSSLRSSRRTPTYASSRSCRRGEALRLRVALRNGSEGAEARLGERVRGRLAELGVERPEVSVERVEALERSAGGKLQVVVAER